MLHFVPFLATEIQNRDKDKEEEVEKKERISIDQYVTYLNYYINFKNLMK